MTLRLPRMTAGASTLIARLSAALLAIAAGACSSEGGGDWRGLFDTVRDSWENRDAPVSLAEASSIPYSTLGIRIGSAREQILVLATDTGGDRLWTSAARIAILTRGGRIVGTAGLPGNISNYASQSGAGSSWFTARRVSWTADFADLGVFSASVTCQDVPAAHEPTTILGQEFNTMRIDETCTSDQLNWNFANTYWVSSSTGRVWRSIQYIHPNMDPLEIQILRPPNSPDQ